MAELAIEELDDLARLAEGAPGVWRILGIDPAGDGQGALVVFYLDIGPSDEDVQKRQMRLILRPVKSLFALGSIGGYGSQYAIGDYLIAGVHSGDDLVRGLVVWMIIAGEPMTRAFLETRACGSAAGTWRFRI